MTSVLVRSPNDSVRYSACAKTEDENQEVGSEPIANVSNDDTEDIANGPRTDRTKLIGGSARIGSIPSSSGRNVELKGKSTSRGSLFEIVTNKFNKKQYNRTYSKESVAYINRAHISDQVARKDIRKLRRKEIDEKFGKRARKGGARFDLLDSSTVSSQKNSCNWTFVFDPSGRLAYWWSLIVSMAFIYNFWVMIYRVAFDEIDHSNKAIWFSMDYIADLLYALDIAFHFRTGYLEDGVLQTDGTKLRIHYMNSTVFYIDCLCLLPLDFLYLSIGYKSIVRCFRLVKIYRFWNFLDRTERHTNYPNVVRTVSLLHYLFAIYHWNACFISIIVQKMNINESYRFPVDTNDESKKDVFSLYLISLYWSTMTLTTIDALPKPQLRGEYVFVIVQFIFALLLFSTILGHVANIVASISTARKDFQTKLDSVKTYMTLRRVPLRLQDRVIKWFDYLWLSKKSSNEESTLNLLPDKLKAEIALHVHLDTLKRVEIFQNTEAGFLCELVLKLRPVLFSPGDYICRKGEVGKEMYIVSRGRLQVVADNGKTVLATLRPGSYFGEISILNMGNAGNRRTASVKSVGYSDLFVLSKNDLWEVLKDYPAARVRLEAIAVKRLEKYKKQPLENKGDDTKALSRSKSTPGLVESSGKTPIEVLAMMPKHHTLPPALLKQRNSQGSTHSAPVSTPCVFIENEKAGEKSTKEEHLVVTDGASNSNKQSPSPCVTIIPTTPDNDAHLTYAQPAFFQPLPFAQSDHVPLVGVRPVSPSGYLTTPVIGYSGLTQAQQQQQQQQQPENLLLELTRLRERLQTLEAENATMSHKLNQQNWNVQQRLNEIEMHICGSEDSTSSDPPNRESVI